MSDLLDKHSPDYDPDAFAGMVDDQRKREKENALDAILPAKPLPNPFTGEVLDADDLDALKSALAEIESFLSDKRKEHRSVYEARDRIQARVAELDPIGLPRISRQTDKQRRVERCPRCKSLLVDSGLEPKADSQLAADGDSSRLPSKGAAEQSSSPEQSELLPRGPRTAAQDAALGVDVFGERTDFGQRPPLPGEAPAASTTQESAAPKAPPATEESSPPETEAALDGGEASAPLDPVVVQAGEVKITRGSAAGKTVAEAVADEPERCLRYLELGKDEMLKGAIVTWLAHARPDLLEKHG